MLNSFAVITLNPYRKYRYMGGGGLLMYVNENIPSRILSFHKTAEDIEVLCVEINLKKQKWFVEGIYRPPCMQKQYFIQCSLSSDANR